MADGMQRDWRELCIAVTNESDPTRLSSLVQELIEALDEGARSWRPAGCPGGTKEAASCDSVRTRVSRQSYKKAEGAFFPVRLLEELR